MLKHAIMSGALEPGNPLVEVSLANWCGVSRTPIREALRRLEQDGLVEHTPSGLVIRKRSPGEILDLYDTRIVLEAMAGRVAAERRTSQDVQQLRWILQRGDESSVDDIQGVVDANRQFHRAIWQASQNESLVDLLERLDLHLGRYPGTTLAHPGRWEAARQQHEDLVSAIDRRDGDAAHEIARQHFIDAREIRLALFAAESSAKRPLRG
jgi:DNA-binding GntR family transcriptional regulator